VGKVRDSRLSIVGRKTLPSPWSFWRKHTYNSRESHENQEISILTIKKARTRLNFLSQRKTSTEGFATLGRKAKMSDKTRRKLTCSMNKSDSLSLVQGPSTVT
jgi:hypothetical protein